MDANLRSPSCGGAGNENDEPAVPDMCAGRVRAAPRSRSTLVSSVNLSIGLSRIAVGERNEPGDRRGKGAAEVELAAK